MSETSTTAPAFAGDAESYEFMIGRWSRRLARRFLAFVGFRKVTAFWTWVVVPEV